MKGIASMEKDGENLFCPDVALGVIYSIIKLLRQGVVDRGSRARMED